MRAWVVAAALWVGLAAPAGPSPLQYDLAWTVFARQGGWQGPDPVPILAGERSGTGVARLLRVSPTVLRLEWQGADGDGRGLIGPTGPTSFEFPSPLPPAGPPPLPHLSGGEYQFTGDRDRPATFTVVYVEGFICRSTPTACDGVSMWERRLEATARRR
jgi:hypothetical protein